MVFSKRLDMYSVSVILLQYQRQVLYENFRFISLKNKSFGCKKNGMLYSDNAKILITRTRGIKNDGCIGMGSSSVYLGS